MLVDLLAQDLLAWMNAAADGVPRRVLLWLDPEAQFRRLVPHVEPALGKHGARLLVCEPDAGPGQLDLKIDLLRLENLPDERAVVYLPGWPEAELRPRRDGLPPGLWSVFEYRFKGAVWGLGEGATWEPGGIPEPPTLLAWLRQHGVTLADGATAREFTVGGADSLPARYAEAQRDRSPSEWPRPLRSADVPPALAGDPRDAIRALLAFPAKAVAEWGDRTPLMVQQLAEVYGLRTPADGSDPESLADDVAVQLALTEAWDAFGRPADFSFVQPIFYIDPINAAVRAMGLE